MSIGKWILLLTVATVVIVLAAVLLLRLSHVAVYKVPVKTETAQLLGFINAMAKEHPDVMGDRMAAVPGLQNAAPEELRGFLDKLLQEHPSLAESVSSEFHMPHLHVAAIRNEAALVEVLLAHGASPSLHCIMPDGDDLGTPLHFAARKGQLETAALLLSHGADVNAQDKYSYTPLHEAVLGPYATALPMVKLLLDHGADIAGKSSPGNTPLDRIQNSEYRGRYGEVIKYLKDHGARSR